MTKITTIYQTDTYKRIEEHRKHCNHWQFGNNVGYGNCLECFGGGLRKFTQDLFREMKDKGIKIEDFE